jgi:hypothetical protein
MATKDTKPGRPASGVKQLAAAVHMKIKEIGDLAGATKLKLTLMRRDIGEHVIRAFSPAAAADRRSFDDIPPKERADLRDGIEKRNRAEMAKLSDDIVDLFIGDINDVTSDPAEKFVAQLKAWVTPTMLYECVNLAASYTPAEINAWIGEGLSMTNMLQASVFADADDRERTFRSAIETGRVSVDSFKEVVDEIEANSEVGMRPASKAAKKAAETKRNKKKAERAGPPADSLPLSRAVEKFGDALNDHHRAAFDNLWGRLENEFDEVDTSTQEATRAVREEIKLPLEATLETIKLILAFRTRGLSDDGSKVGTGKRAGNNKR